jgi:hypothetical protein
MEAYLLLVHIRLDAQKLAVQGLHEILDGDPWQNG